MCSYVIGEIMTPTQGPQAMLIRSYVTPIDQNTHSVWTGTQR